MTLRFAAICLLLAGASVAHGDVRDGLRSIASVAQEETQVQNSDAGTLVLGVYRSAIDGASDPVRLDDVIELDVATDLARCDDGNLRVNAIAIGSWQFDIDGECAADALTPDITVVWNDLTQIRSAP